MYDTVMSFIHFEVIQGLIDLVLALNGSKVVTVTTSAGGKSTFLIRSKKCITFFGVSKQNLSQKVITPE